jgi:hypothetical protein
MTNNRMEKSHGTPFRVPRKSKKAQTALFNRTATANQMRRLRRMWVMSPLRWDNIRRVAMHVALGDTITLRLCEIQERRTGVKKNRRTLPYVVEVFAARPIARLPLLTRRDRKTDDVVAA